MKTLEYRKIYSPNPINVRRWERRKIRMVIDKNIKSDTNTAQRNMSAWHLRTTVQTALPHQTPLQRPDRGKRKEITCGQPFRPHSHTRPHTGARGRKSHETEQRKEEQSFKIASKFCRPGYYSCTLKSQLGDFQHILTNVEFIVLTLALTLCIWYSCWSC